MRWVSSWRAWYALGVLFAAALLAYTDRYILNVLIGNLRADLHLSDTQVSLVQGAAFAVIYAFAALPMGRLADRVSRRNLILAGLLTWSAGTAACGLASGMGSLVFWRLVVGVGEAALFPAAVSLLADSFEPARRGLIMGVLLMGTSMGVGVAVILGAGLLGALSPGVYWPYLGALAPWRAVLLVLAACGTIVMGAVALIREPPRSRSPNDAAGSAGASPRAAVRFAVAHRGELLPLLLACALIAVIDAASSAWTPTYFIRNFHYTPAEVAGDLGWLTLCAGALGYLLGGIGGDALRRRGGRLARVRLIAAAASLALPLLCYGAVDGARAALLIYAGFAFVVGVANVGCTAAILEIVPNAMQGTAIAILAFVLILTGLASGPTFVALITQHLLKGDSSVGISIILVGAISLIPAIAMLWKGARTAASARTNP